MFVYIVHIYGKWKWCVLKTLQTRIYIYRQMRGLTDTSKKFMFYQFNIKSLKMQFELKPETCKALEKS